MKNRASPVEFMIGLVPMGVADLRARPDYMLWKVSEEPLRAVGDLVDARGEWRTGNGLPSVPVRVARSVGPHPMRICAVEESAGFTEMFPDPRQMLEDGKCIDMRVGSIDGPIQRFQVRWNKPTPQPPK
jgi:hypothetical protein